MLVGKTGAGKSATGNTILGEEAFRVEASPASVTAHCEEMKKAVNGRNVTVIDTPGVMDTWLMSDQTAHNAPSCIFRSSSPHVFLLVIRLGRFTQEERNAVKWIQENFGDEAMKFTLILFTGGDLLSGKPVEKFITNSYDLQDLVDFFEGRCHVFSNMKNDTSQVTELFKKIDLLLYESMGYYHTKELYEEAEKNTRIEEKRKRVILEKEIREEEAQKRTTMEKLIRQEEEVKREQISRKIKEEEIRKCMKKEGGIRQEEEAKRRQMEEEMKAEERRKVNEMAIKLRDEQYAVNKLQAELEAEQSKNFWCLIVAVIMVLILFVCGFVKFCT